MHFGSQLGIGNSLLCPFQSLKMTVIVGLRLLIYLMEIMQAASQS